jgi:ATP-binding protein involved in chromosome partitioning
MSIPFLGRIPLDPEIRRDSDSGRPPAAGDDEKAAIFAAIAASLSEQLERAAMVEPQTGESHAPRP